METTLAAATRTGSGKGVARKGRAAGHVPAVLYGRDVKPLTLSIDPTALVDLFKTTRNRNTIVQLVVDGSAPVPCLVREVQRHPVGRQILHVDFYAVPETPIEVMVPLRPVGRPKGALLGGRLRLIRREVKAVCRYDRIPEAFDVDVSELEVDDYLNASQIPMPHGVSLVYHHDYNVMNLYGKSKIREDLPPEPGKPTEVEADAAAPPSE